LNLKFKAVKYLENSLGLLLSSLKNIETFKIKANQLELGEFNSNIEIPKSVKTFSIKLENQATPEFWNIISKQFQN